MFGMFQVVSCTGIYFVPVQSNGWCGFGEMKDPRI